MSTVVCLASYFKGVAFLKAAKARGWRVILVTSDSLKDVDWPRDAVDEFFYMPGPKDEWDQQLLLQGMDYVATTEKITKIVALDDFDVERAALVREHLRVPGMGQTRARYFRDKLAMRDMAKEIGVAVPEYVAPFHPDEINEFLDRVSAPWILKPRSQASAAGIKKFYEKDALWRQLDTLKEQRTHYVLEQFLPGDVFHIDALAHDGRIFFARSHRYLAPPMAVSHEGGIFRSVSLPFGSPDDLALRRLNAQIAKGFGMRYSAMHTEFLKADHDGKFYFIETSSRVGGANIAEMVEAGSGVNLWAEWANIETLQPGETYTPPEPKSGHSGILISLARQEWPELEPYNDPEVVWRMKKAYHAGLIVTHENHARVAELLDTYAERFFRDFHASAPPSDKVQG